MANTFLYKSTFFPGVVDPLKDRYIAGKHYPKLSVIVPSYNQGEYLEETILSIINQQYPNLELIIVDGGSTDNSVDIIKHYEKDISYWVSEKDKGQSDAINKGLQKATGEWIAWLNSDDCYREGALQYIFNEIDLDSYDFLYGNCYVGQSMANPEEHRHPEHEKRGLRDILKFFYNVSHIIPSQSIFVRKVIVDKAGLLDMNMHYCMDLDWFARIYLQTERRLFYYKTICFYRINETTKTSNNFHKMAEEAMQIALKYSIHLNDKDRADLKRLISYYKSLLSYMRSNKKNLFKILKIGLLFPSIAVRDVRFKTMLKKRIINNEK